MFKEKKEDIYTTEIKDLVSEALELEAVIDKAQHSLQVLVDCFEEFAPLCASSSTYDGKYLSTNHKTEIFSNILILLNEYRAKYDDVVPAIKGTVERYNNILKVIYCETGSVPLDLTEAVTEYQTPADIEKMVLLEISEDLDLECDEEDPVLLKFTKEENEPIFVKFELDFEHFDLELEGHTKGSISKRRNADVDDALDFELFDLELEELDLDDDLELEDEELSLEDDLELDDEPNFPDGIPLEKLDEYLEKRRLYSPSGYCNYINHNEELRTDIKLLKKDVSWFFERNVSLKDLVLLIKLKKAIHNGSFPSQPCVKGVWFRDKDLTDFIIKTKLLSDKTTAKDSIISVAKKSLLENGFIERSLNPKVKNYTFTM
nr:hypothetical protein [Moritella viscosa]SHO15760.1 2-oxoglutarate dehydrogenase E1 component-Alpha-ketoglutarate dehydrogenase [Moritella viscosa]